MPVVAAPVVGASTSDNDVGSSSQKKKRVMEEMDPTTIFMVLGPIILPIMLLGWLAATMLLLVANTQLYLDGRKLVGEVGVKWLGWHCCCCRIL